MASAKDKHYWSQLRAALTAGNWRVETAAHAPNGEPLTWDRLIYKFNKHCRGFQDIADIACNTRALALLLGAGVASEDSLGNEPSDELRLGDECVLSPECMRQAEEGLETLRKQQGKRSDSLDIALAYYSYALGRPAECLSYLHKVPCLIDAQSHIPASSTTRSDNSALQVPCSTTGTSSSWTGSLILAPSSASISDISDGRAWAMTESFRSICLQGMAYEKLEPAHPEKAIQAYAAALPLLNIVEFEILRSLTMQSSPTSFSYYRELWRWSERLMFRAITLLARVEPLTEPDGLLWTFFTHYETCSVHWPPTFRFSHRSIVAVLHLRALVLRYRIPSEEVSLNTSLQPLKPPQWLSIARSVANEYRMILDKCTHFPQAGERNNKVEDFVDLCVAVWEASGFMSDRAGWVIDILWWATRLTFHSYRIFRHMSRLLYISGDSELAKRTLRLYVQVVSKSREAAIDSDYDTDRHWVETLVEGSRMLCRLAVSRMGADGLDEAREAGELIEKAKSRLDPDDKELVSRVALAEGVWLIVSAITELDPQERPRRFALALDLLIKAVGTYPTPAAHHHLALALALPGPLRNLEDAISFARAAVEDAADEIRHWHLLGLLLTAQEQWEKAKSIMEIAANIGEAPESEENGDSDSTARHGEAPTQNGIKVRDFEKTPVQYSATSSRVDVSNSSYAPNRESAAYPAPLLGPEATGIPPSAALLQPLPDHPAPSPRDAFEYALQLRLTQMALTEHVEGPEGAEAKWVTVYGWIADRKGSVPNTPLRSSMDTSLRSAGTHLCSTVLVSASQEGETETRASQEHLGSLGLSIVTSDGGPQPPPITITPATPADAEYRLSLGGESREKMKRSASMDRDPSAGKKMQQMLKERVHKGQEKISTISKKIGHGVVRSGTLHLRRANSAPDFHAAFENQQYQASSIHSRRRLGSLMRHRQSRPALESPPAPPPPALPPVHHDKIKPPVTREDRLLSELWAASAATFRRTGKIEQAKGAIQEAEVKNPDNPAVWVQFGLYHYALNHEQQAVEALQKALFISPEDVSAAVHMCRIYVESSISAQGAGGAIDQDKVDLSAGLLAYVTRCQGWDVPEAWYYLSKAYRLQGRKDAERECLVMALKLSEGRCIRDIGRAVGWCL